MLFDLISGAISGTDSVEDLHTDVAFTPERFHYKRGPLGPSQTALCHAGIKKGADYVIAKSGTLLKEHAENGYTVTFTGHSLGAGTAALASIMLMQQFGVISVLSRPRVQCFAYATPAMVTRDLGASPWARGLITSVVNDDDCIPRSSLSSLTRMYGSLDIAVDHCSVPPHPARAPCDMLGTPMHAWYPHAPCDMLYYVPMLFGWCLMLAIRWCA